MRARLGEREPRFLLVDDNQSALARARWRGSKMMTKDFTVRQLCWEMFDLRNEKALNMGNIVKNEQDAYRWVRESSLPENPVALIAFAAN